MHKIKTKYGIEGFTPFECEIPDECPYCSTKIKPLETAYIIRSYSAGNPASYFGMAILKCPCTDNCGKHFYVTHLISGTTKNLQAKILDIYPRLKNISFDKIIQECSPRFTEIYNGAYEAEQNGYYEIAGAGYRIAMEFLIKDYLIQVFPDKKSEIEKQKLVHCIKTYFGNDESLFTMADVVRLLGNDYAHYINKNEDIDFEEIRIFLDYFVLHIKMRLKIKNPPVARPERTLI